MSVQTIDAKMLQKMFLAGAKGLEAKKEYINELNVFPVPDDDDHNGCSERSSQSSESDIDRIGQSDFQWFT